jgi:uncharacterized membrane protein YfcA
VRLILIGLFAGLASGLFGVGGGIVMVPLLVWLIAFDQHRAHATSLAAMVAIAASGAIVFGTADSIDYPVAGLLAVGSLIGAPLGAWLLSRWPASRLKVALGVLIVVIGITMVWP